MSKLSDQIRLLSKAGSRTLSLAELEKTLQEDSLTRELSDKLKIKVLKQKDIFIFPTLNLSLEVEVMEDFPKSYLELFDKAEKETYTSGPKDDSVNAVAEAILEIVYLLRPNSNKKQFSRKPSGFSLSDVKESFKNPKLLKTLQNLLQSSRIKQHGYVFTFATGATIEAVPTEIPPKCYLEINYNNKNKTTLLNSSSIQEIAASIVEALEIFNLNEPIMTGLGRPTYDQNRGISYSPNTYNEPTYYKVIGTDFTGRDQTKEYNIIYNWLKENDIKKLPTKDPIYGAMGSSTLWRIVFKNNEWFVVSYYTYTGG